MTQNEQWEAKCREYMNFIKTNKRCPSKYHEDERNMHSWYKHNRKVMNADMMRPSRVAAFKQLIKLAEKHHHINQFQ